MLCQAMARMAVQRVVPRLTPVVSGLLLPSSCLHTTPVVERARQSTRIKKRKVNMANKKKKEERLRRNPPPVPKKVQLQLIAKGLGGEPRPWRAPDLRPFPSDDVWSQRWHSWRRLGVGEAVEVLREHFHPTVINRPDAMVWARLEFNMAAVKKDKYIEAYSAMVPIFHPFERGVAEKQIMVFGRDPELLKLAEAAGAFKVPVLLLPWLLTLLLRKGPWI